mmetsp:Transcript_106633/g.340261  ORF Transcript_106633/g.340261 Transcript_106633/m.340261 type:complete len:237 (+) Transcript_106633:108-818(+)
MPSLSLEYIKHETGEFDEESIFQAILTKRSIPKIEAVNLCINLRWLDLSNNQIIRIENLDGLSQLVSLDLSSNKISKVENLGGVEMLERLKLRANPISRIQDLEGLRPLKKLKHLHFQNIDGSDFCPVCLKAEYKRNVMELCPDLVALDSKRKGMPDLDKEIKFFEDAQSFTLPEAESWFTKDDLDMQDIQCPQMVAAMMQPQVGEFESALKDCEAVFKEAEGLLRLQELKTAEVG